MSSSSPPPPSSTSSSTSSSSSSALLIRHRVQEKVATVLRHGQRTKDKLATELRCAIEEVERQRLHKSQQLTELLHTLEEKETKKRLRTTSSRKEEEEEDGTRRGGRTRVVSAEAAHHLRRPYEYNATCGSVLEILFFQRFWTALSTRIPVWIMPCSVTFAGLALNLVCCSIIMYYETDVPRWAFVVCALGIFLYQTFDALDGKQATKVQNTQLEEFADHGSDSLSTNFVTLSVGLAMQLGPGWLVTSCFVSSVAFYSTHWQTHVTNVVVFGRVDVTEAQCTMMGIHLLTAAFGPSFWLQQLFGLQLGQWVVVSASLLLAVTVARNARIIAGGATPLFDSLFASVPRRQLSLATLFPAVPLLAWLISALSTSFLVPTLPRLFCVFFGVIFTKLLLRLQLATIGQTDCPVWDRSLVVPLLLVVNQRLNWIVPSTALLSALVLVTIDLVGFATLLVWDVCDLQDIHAFTLKYPLGHPKNRAGSNGIYVNGLNNRLVMDQLAEKNKNKNKMAAAVDDNKRGKTTTTTMMQQA